jgi:flavin reductase (DIM6/NTAB) family NADH-FMN oxidoreductase RutF
MQKKSIELHVMWHINSLMHSFPITLVTTMDVQGRINAAPYSLVIPYCSSPKNPQMLLIANKNWHTAKNIMANGEFVLNYPTADQMKEINETARFYPEGVNELEHTSFTTLPSQFVRPPRIAECYQHVECRVKEVIKPSQIQLNFIADVLDLSLDEAIYEVPRIERAKKTNAPIFLGVDEQQQYIYGRIGELEPFPVSLNVKE